MTWARVIGYAAGVLGAACLAVLLTGSPAAAGGSDRPVGDLLGSAGSGLAQLDRTVGTTASEAVARTVPATVRRVAEAERRVTDEARAAVDTVAPVPVVADTVEHVTAVADDATGQVSDRVAGSADAADDVAGPDEGPAPGLPAELVAQPHVAQSPDAEPAAPRRTTGRAGRSAPAVLERVPAAPSPNPVLTGTLVDPVADGDLRYLPHEGATAPHGAPDLPSDGAGSVDGPTVAGLATLGGSARLPAPGHLDSLTRDRSVHASPPHRPGFSPD